MPKVITEQGLFNLDGLANKSKRKRAHVNLHENFSELVQRVVISAEQDSYVQPHRHADKPWELMILLSGVIDVLLFSEEGNLKSRVELRENENRIIEYDARTFHAAVILKQKTRVLEIKEGPYNPETAKECPEWAPHENSEEAYEFLNKMKSLCVGETIN